ncbi:MAG TPA: hypothetical protein VH856_06845 [Steroidobacteraceae bacterium]|jgi:hypothetical protein
MKTIITGLVAAGLGCAAAAAAAQEHWTEGPVWECAAYRTNPGMFDTYMKWIRSHSEPINEEARKQGLILDYKSFVKAPGDENDYDVLFCTLYPSYGKALDYSKADDEAYEKISAAHWATADQDRQREQAAPRLEMRRFLGVTYVREVDLRPMP